jgi:hypothetical protein
MKKKKIFKHIWHKRMGATISWDIIFKPNTSNGHTIMPTLAHAL